MQVIVYESEEDMHFFCKEFNMSQVTKNVSM
jgi:hypothetical protein